MACRATWDRFSGEVHVQNNPVGLDGLEFIEFASPDVGILESLVERIGMTLVARHKTKNLRLFRQNEVAFLINNEPAGHAAEFRQQHGPSACAMGFRVKDAQFAFAEAVRRGARPYTDNTGKSGWNNMPAIYGIGDALVYFVDKYGDKGEIYDDGNWEWLTSDHHPQGLGLLLIDHMTNNVPVGEMQKWCDFYTNVFGFEERRYFDIKGKSTGLISKVMKSPCGKFSIPINEPTDSKSQIQEYLDEYKGSGIQHIALLTEDAVGTVEKLKKLDVEFLNPPPDTYYDLLPTRLPQVTEPIPYLKKNAILVDGDPQGYLLQIFTQNVVGPIFLEIIQRRRHDGFGEGNFQALFDSIEEDQRRRGVL